MSKRTINKDFPNELFVVSEQDGEHTYFCAHETAVYAVESRDEKRAVVATYRLVRTEDLILERTTRVKKAKQVTA